MKSDGEILNNFRSRAIEGRGSNLGQENVPESVIESFTARSKSYLFNLRIVKLKHTQQNSRKVCNWKSVLFLEIVFVLFKWCGFYES